MKQYSFVFLIFLLLGRLGFAQEVIDSSYMVKAFSIAAPKPDGLTDFIKFIQEELVPRKVNTLILRVDYNYEFKSHPELRDSVALSSKDVKKLVKTCQEAHIQIIPQINLLGHQSWAFKTGNLLKAYPEFDETPWVEMPADKEYKWPNADGLYCKSYCPLHPGVHQVVFDVVDEIMEAFAAKAFHAGMDEVFYLGEDKCPRCGGRDKAVLFANEVQTIRDHLATHGQELWIWGDRLLDGRTTGVGMWAGSYNQTYRAIDMIPRDVVICDWQYDKDNQTPVYFALKGLRVVICAWNRPEVAISQVENLFKSRSISDQKIRYRFYGIAHTVWSGPVPFFKGFYENTPDEKNGNHTPWYTFKAMFDRINQHQSQ